MATHSSARVALMLVGLLMVLVAATFNTMTEFGAKSGAKFVSVFLSRFSPSCRHFRAPLTRSAARLSGRRRLPAEGGGGDAQVPDAHHAGALGLLRVGLHLFLDFCHVHVLPGRTLQKVCPQNNNTSSTC